MPDRLALFPGSFDPMTLGHVDLLRRAIPLFDEIVILVANDGKAGFWPAAKRAQLWRDILAADEGLGGCKVAVFKGLLVAEYSSRKACAVVRGVRTAQDYEQEWGLHMVNRKLLPEYETIWLPARDDLAALSSSLVREVARHGGPLDALVPQPVVAALSDGSSFGPDAGGNSRPAPR